MCMETQSNEGKVDAGRMNYNIIKILPKNINIIKICNQLNTE